MSDLIVMSGLLVFLLLFIFILFFIFYLPRKIQFYFSDSGKYFREIKRFYLENRNTHYLNKDHPKLGRICIRFSSYCCNTIMNYKDKTGFLEIELDPVNSPFGIYTIHDCTLNIPEKFQLIFAKKLHSLVHSKYKRGS